MEIKISIMNLKERGITVGDLMIILIIVITAVLIVNKKGSDDNQAYFESVGPQILTTNKY